MSTATLRKSTRLRRVSRKAVPARRTKRAAFVLSEAEIARINGAQVSLG